MHKWLFKKISKSVFFVGLILMILAQSVLLAFLPVGKIETVQAVDWYSTGGTWLYRRPITIDYTQVPSTQSNFPVLITLTDSGLINDAQVDGDDFLITSSNGTTKLNHEIESWSTTTGALVVWVNVPSLSSSADTVLYLYYGNRNASNQQNKTAVWDSDYRMVHHMYATSSVYYDSTSVANNGTAVGDTASYSTSKIGTGVSFDGNGDFIDLANQTNYTSESYSFWFYDNGSTQTASGYAGATIISQGVSGCQALGLYIATGNKIRAYDWDGGAKDLITTDTFNTNAWNFVSFKRTQSGTASLSINNGTPVTNGSWSANFAYCTPNYDINRVVHDSNSTFNGRIDEVRFSKIARSADWVTSEYNNQNNPTSFAAVGAEEAVSTTNLSNWGYRKLITIDSTKVPSTQTNFPVLINLATDANLAARAKNDGSDLLFVPASVAWSSGTLSDELTFEIEKYDSSTGQLVAWVKIPSLSSVSDYTFYLYYGNTTPASNNDAALVWNNNFQGVWHMNDDPTAGAPQLIDSTTSGVNGTANGTLAVSTTGKYGNATNFNGTTGYYNLGNNLNHDGPLTLSADFKPTSIGNSSRDTVVAKSGGSSDFDLQINTDDSNLLYFYLSAGGNTSVKSTSAISSNQWTHVDVVWDKSSGDLKLYLNGSLERTTAGITGGRSTNSNNLCIGQSCYFENRFFKGLIDEVRISNVARSGNWITAEYNNQNSPSTFYTLGSEDAASASCGDNICNGDETSISCSADCSTSTATTTADGLATILANDAIIHVPSDALGTGVITSSSRALVRRNLQITDSSSNVVTFLAGTTIVCKNASSTEVACNLSSIAMSNTAGHASSITGFQAETGAYPRCGFDFGLSNRDLFLTGGTANVTMSCGVNLYGVTLNLYQRHADGIWYNSSSTTSVADTGLAAFTGVTQFSGGEGGEPPAAIPEFSTFVYIGSILVCGWYVVRSTCIVMPKKKC